MQSFKAYYLTISERVYMIDLYATLPIDINAIPQNYTIHCIVVGMFDGATIKMFYGDEDGVEFNQSFCNKEYEGYNCINSNEEVVLDNAHTSTEARDYTLAVEWKANNIENGTFKQSQDNGDHKFTCTAASGAIKSSYMGRSKYIFVKGTI